MTDELTQRMSEFGARLDAVRTDVRALVMELLVPGPGRYLVMERLPRLGSLAAPAARELADDESNDPEVRVMAALVALECGDSANSGLLLDEVEQHGELGQLAAARLAAHQSPEVGAAIVRALRSIGQCGVDVVVGYLSALRTAGGKLPDDVRAELIASEAWQVTSAVDEWFPA